MNFGKSSTQKKRKNLTSATSRMGNLAGVTFLRILFLSFAAVCIIIACMGFGAFRSILDHSPDISDVNIMPIGNATFVYDADGNQLQKLSAPTANRMSVSIDKIPLNMQHAIVAIEDERFYEHNGIDVRGILRAFVNGIANGFHFNEGASTLTQQLLKNNVFTNWTNEGTIERFKRKFQEQYLALQLEQALTADGQDAKSVILENYLNTINMSAGTYGVQAASQRYFGKDCSQLTLSECAVLAAIPQNPYSFNPIRHPEKNAERRQKVLKHMLEQGYITQAEHDEALADNVYERIQETDSSLETSKPYSYFIDELTSQIINDLQEQKGYTKVQAQTALYSGGLQIFTTQDPDIQAIMDEEYQNEDNFPSSIQVGLDWALTVEKADGSTQNYSKEMMKLYFRDHENDQFDLLFDSEEQAQEYVNRYKEAIVGAGDKIIAERISFAPQPQSSMVIIDQRTGYVKALVGGRGQKTASLTLNRATDTYRQPGSTFKPIAVYGPAINDFSLTLADTYVDQPITYESNGRPVRNAYGDYKGVMTVRDAIKYSCNTIAIQCFRDITPRLGYNYLKKLGFERVTDHEVINGQVFDDAREPTALGGITNGVSTLELTAAYAAVANGGTYTKPIFYTKILDHNGNILLENTPETSQVYRESTAYLLTSAMESVVNEEGGTGTALRLSNIPVAGKTGTTSATRDVWFAGFTPYYTCAVWAGYDTNEYLLDDCKNFHKTLWTKVMSRVHAKLPYKDFEVPSNVQQATICAESGLLAGLGCTTKTEYFETSTIPTVRCTQHYVPPTPEPTPEPTVDPITGLYPDGTAPATPEGTPTTPDGSAPQPGNETPTPDNGTTTPVPTPSVPDPGITAPDNGTEAPDNGTTTP
ncbi:MAG: PBP1A family penicillin-binding protein [Eubacterium sp.]|nr:PBP1A family penicillin-binding protein [Eubacterium sp.]